ncbi:threonine/serine dehydratase [Halomonas sp. MCCC 1A17488]|uniref:threonine ammonia-lyase n=1 Tax=unclassified Halomonas TaxID=2609666 RepID=UPI0018D22F3D|nr:MULTISPECIES: threonine/serine dehydratase [unclassified Halomonas]MCE8015548.1 threonine/serine dehydratase [Halomonas sp. MCCC 1A17488]MCG3238881.1 threonine/serine dehydratase [Halomonas sp. MCCC 1A17488]QPP51158.1 threonine/serine dehydratase [Halomonas sp. SS10-MC5]
MLPLERLQSAQRLIADTLPPTPLLLDHGLSDRLGRRVWLKGELFQRTGSFKPRGALHWVRTAKREELAGGLGAVSAGNHALGLAWAAGQAGVPVTIVMPENASRFKVEGSRELGAEVILYGDINAAWERMHELVAERGLTLVHPYDDERIIAGQGTVGLEILEQAPEATAILCPVGGGGLIAGIGSAAAALRPELALFGVEPCGAASMAHAWAQGAPSRLGKVETCAKSLGAAIVGEHTYPICRETVRALAQVDDAAIGRALHHLLYQAKLMAEPGAAVGVAALLEEAVALPPEGDVVVVITGGNMSREELEPFL